MLYNFIFNIVLIFITIRITTVETFNKNPSTIFYSKKIPNVIDGMQHISSRLMRQTPLNCIQNNEVIYNARKTGTNDQRLEEIDIKDTIEKDRDNENVDINGINSPQMDGTWKVSLLEVILFIII